MKTILVPTDFSELSTVALRYAVKIAAELKAQITLVSVINVNATSQTLMKWQRLEEEMLEIAEQDANRIISEIRDVNAGAVQINYQSLKGFPVETVLEKYVTQNSVDMIVMGTKGASGAKMVLLGSNATAVIDHSSIPVLVIPGDAGFHGINRIVYATDIKHLDFEVQTIATYAKVLNAEISILHVVPESESPAIDATKVAHKLIDLISYQNVTFHVVQNDNIADAVEKFCTDRGGDILAMFTHKLHFYEKLFGKSITQRLAFHAKIPLLTFNKTMLR